MKTTLKKSGNSYAVLIPKSLAKELGLEYCTAVELILENGKLVAQPIIEETIRLDDLLIRITRKNLHRIEDIGAPIGNEIW